MMLKIYKQIFTILFIALGMFPDCVLAVEFPAANKTLIFLKDFDKLQSPWEIAINPNHAKSIQKTMKQWPINLINMQGHKVIKMTYNFTGNNIGRALYKKKVKLDLSKISTINMDVMVSNPATLRNGMTIYFKSGSGWYSGNVIPSGKLKWTKVRISRCEFCEYGKTAGWDNISEIRFSPWALAREAGSIYVANFGFVPPNCKVAILKQNSKDKKTSAAYIYNMTAYVNNLMDSGITPLPISSLDYDRKPLGKNWTIFLPSIPQIRKKTIARLCEHINKGGKIVAIESLHPEIAKCLGVKLKKYKGNTGRGNLLVSQDISPIIPKNIPFRDTLLYVPELLNKDGKIFAQWSPLESEQTYPGAYISSKGAYIPVRARFRRNETSLLLLGILSHFNEKVIKNAVDHYLNGPGWSFDCSWKKAQEEIATLPLYKNVRDDYRQIRGIINNAKQFAKMQKYPEALKNLIKAKTLLKKTYVKAWKIPDFDFFATSIRDDMPIDKLIPFLKACHITDVTMKVGSGAASAYSNSIKPQWKNYRSPGKKDFIIKRIKAFADAGIHIWIERQNLVSSPENLTPQEFGKLKKEKRLAVAIDGKIVNDWLCPTHPDIIQEQCKLMVESAKLEGVYGVAFDLIRYTTMPDTCFCERCKQLFEKRIGHKINWNIDVSTSGKYRKEWLQFRTDNITEIVKTASAAVRKIKPDTKIMAFVFSNYPTCKYNNGQDWKLWIQKGYIDKVGPMNYVNGVDAFTQMVKAQNKVLGNSKKLYPGIGLSEGLGTIEALRQITAAQKAGVDGVYLFAFWGAYVRTVFAKLKK